MRIHEEFATMAIRRPWSRKAKVKDSWQCHGFKPSTAEDPPCRGGLCSLNMSRIKHPPVGVEVRSGWGCQLRCRPRPLTMVQNARSVANSSRAAL
ncbi:hypothetical protein TNCV_730451 [Trichonephila clavipes]|nr:hypothetical protein TNCV_730451 [Trichonephila clavipes]